MKLLILYLLLIHIAQASWQEDEKKQANIVKNPIAFTYFAPIENLPDELMHAIFLSFHKKDIPFATAVNKNWIRLMHDNRLWHRYGRKAKLIMENALYSEQKDYKAFFKSYCIPSFIDLGTSRFNK